MVMPIILWSSHQIVNLYGQGDFMITMDTIVDEMENIKRIKNRIVVFSGKGGVGKTTISINIAFAMAKYGFKVGLMDADITGPNIPKMLGMKGDMLVNDNGKIVPMERSGVKLVSMGFMIDEKNPIIWRGPLKTKAIKQFLSDVDWGDIDTLIVDLPPGTGDEILTIIQYLHPNKAVIVTTPENVSVLDASRAVEMAKKFSIPFIGVIENMSGVICPKCGYEIDIFGKGGGKKMADEKGVEFLGFCPMDVSIRNMIEKGKIPVVDGDCEFSKSMIKIAEKLSR